MISPNQDCRYMRKMSDTINRLAAMRARPIGHASTEAQARLAPLGDFGSNPGALNAWLHVPEKPSRKMPLVVVLHGCTQTAAAYDHGSGWSALADQHGFAVLYPEQQRSNNPNLCFNWFVPSDTRRGSGETASIQQMIETMIARHRIDAGRVFITGLSAGGAMASAMLATHPELFAGGAIIAGLPHGVANTIPEAFDRMRGHGIPSDQALQALLRDASNHQGPWPTVSVWQGTSDNTVAAANAQAIVAQWRAAHKLDARAPETDRIDGYPRGRWQDAKGRVLVEEVTVTGMGHGTPLSTGGKNGVGAAGPFMLDVGISSTRHIAAGWGILGGVGATVEKPIETKGPKSRAVVPASAQTNDKPRLLRVEPQQSKPKSAQHDEASAGVGKIITDALRAAGLMR